MKRTRLVLFRGFTLVEILVASAIGTIVLLAFSKMFVNQNQSVLLTRATMTRDQLKNLAEKYLASVPDITQSLYLTGNESFHACYSGGTTSTCTTAPCCNVGATTQTVSGQAFSLLDPATPNPSPSPATGTLFSGPSASPKRYDVNGAPCASAGGICIFRMTTSFSATCPTAAACTQAQAMSVTYTVDVDPAAGFSAGFLQPVSKAIAILGGSTTGSSTSDVPLVFW